MNLNQILKKEFDNHSQFVGVTFLQWADKMEIKVEKEYVGNEYNGWNKYRFVWEDEQYIFSPRSGVDGSGSWYLKKI